MCAISNGLVYKLNISQVFMPKTSSLHPTNITVISIRTFTSHLKPIVFMLLYMPMNTKIMLHSVNILKVKEMHVTL